MVKMNKDFMAGAIVGFGAGIATRILPSVNRDEARTGFKSALKWALVTADTARERLMQLKESVQDLTAEARAEAEAMVTREHSQEQSAEAAVEPEATTAAEADTVVPYKRKRTAKG